MSGQLSIFRIHGNKFQPREKLGDVSSLVESIREKGLLEKIKIMPCSCEKLEGPHFRILDGHRRHRAMGVLHHVTLSDSEYEIKNEKMTLEEEMDLVHEVNIERMQYSPVELYNALKMRKKYGFLKESAERSGKRYSTLRHLYEAMERLAPELREKVVWGRGNKGGITVGMATDLAEVHDRSYQVALVDAELSRAQLKAAVELFKEHSGVMTAERAIREAGMTALKIGMEDQANLAAIAFGIAMVKGAVRVKDLVALLGFTPWTSRRVLRKLERGSTLRGGSVDPGKWKFLREIALATQKERDEFLRRLFGERN